MYQNIIVCQNHHVLMGPCLYLSLARLPDVAGRRIEEREDLCVLLREGRGGMVVVTVFLGMFPRAPHNVWTGIWSNPYQRAMTSNISHSAREGV